MKLDTAAQKWTFSTSLTGYAVAQFGWMWTLTRFDPSSPLESIIKDIERAIEAKLYYPALLITLTLPEICMGLTLDKSQFVKKNHYVDFVDRYTTSPGLGLDGESCFHLRGGLVHRADLTGHAFFEGTHVVFTVPETGVGLHAFSIEAGEKKAAMFDLGLFSTAMIDAVRAWYEEHKNDEQVIKNMKNLIRWRPKGVPPFVGGMPVVASGA